MTAAPILPLPNRDFHHAPLRIALAGAGSISLHHLIAWAREKRARVVAICDPDLERAKSRAADFGITQVFAEAGAMLDACRAEAIDIASPRETHAALVEMAAAWGVHVLCQKPVTPMLAEGEALLHSVAGTVRVMVHENWRFRPWYRDLKAWFDAGDVGTPHEVDLSMHSSGLLPDASGLRPNLVRHPFMAREPRLMIAEVLIHHLDVLRWLLGPLRVREVYTARTIADLPGETRATILLDTADGLPVTLRGSMVAAGFPVRTQDRLTIVGDRVSVVFEGMQLALLGEKPCKRFYRFERDYQRSFDGAIAHFVDALIGGIPFETDLADNLETLRLVEQSYAAAAITAGRPENAS